jgi:RNA polymerase sigma factor (sigma-70 family)
VWLPGVKSGLSSGLILTRNACRIIASPMTSEDAKRQISDWFHQWRSPLRRFLLGKVRVRSADVDDVAQEVFLRLMRYGTAELVEHPRAYLYKVASNVAAEWSIRARNQRPHDSKWLSSLIDGHQPELPLLRGQIKEEIERGLAMLAANEREVLQLYFNEHLTHAQIAARRGESLRSVRRRFIKSYEKLRAVLDVDLLGEITYGSD